MVRHAFKMKLKPGTVDEYRRRHAAIWPELAEALRQAGISDYAIFLDEDAMTLFAIQKQSNPAAVSELRNHAIVRRWWDYMAPLMEVEPDNAPVCVRLEEVFYLA